MEFKKERVYSAVNADELKPGDKVIVADTMQGLVYKVKANEGIIEIDHIEDAGEVKRFSVKNKHETVTTEWHLAYLVERKESCTNCGEGKWDAEHQKILCDSVHYGNGNVVFRNHEIEVCRCWKPKTEQKAEHDCQSCKYKNCGFKDFNTKNECDRWETEPHYRPFKDADELVKTWIAKRMITFPDLCMPHIWVRLKDFQIRDLITGFGRAGVQINADLVDWSELYNEYEFLDGSPCGVEE